MVLQYFYHEKNECFTGFVFGLRLIVFIQFLFATADVFEEKSFWHDDGGDEDDFQKRILDDFSEKSC